MAAKGIPGFEQIADAWAGRAPLGDHDPVRAEAGSGTHDGTEVARIGHLVETRKQRKLGGCELPPVRVLVRLAPREHALVVAGACCFAELALR